MGHLTVRGLIQAHWKDIDAQKPIIQKDLSSTIYEYKLGENAEPLVIKAESVDNGTLSYQWYSNTQRSNTGGTPISGATSDTYSPLTDKMGTIYYYVAITNTNNGKATTVTSNIAAVTVLTIKNCTVTFKDWNGNMIKSETVNYGEAATAPPNPTRNGYTFTGWDVAFDNVKSDLTVIAQYIINNYTVTFKDWDGTILKSETVNYGEAATAPPNPTRNGYIFTGWDTVFDNIASDLTVTAQYAKMPIQDVDILDEAKALDPSNADDMEKLKELESIYKDRENVTVNITADPNTHGDFKQNIDAISVVGAAFNAKQNETITLHFSKPANNVVIDGTRYKTNNAVQFDIRLMNGATPLQNLDVPVTITVPIPSGVQESNFWILHYHNNGDYEVITPKLNGDGTCTFTVANFSVFAFVNGVEESENGGTVTVSTDPKSTSNAPKTGDETNVINWLLVAAMSAIAITIILILHRKYTGDIR